MRDHLGDIRSVLLLGGTSDIGLAIVRRLSVPGQAKVVLAGRDKEALAVVAAGLLQRNVAVANPSGASPSGARPTGANPTGASPAEASPAEASPAEASPAGASAAEASATGDGAAEASATGDGATGAGATGAGAPGLRSGPEGGTGGVATLAFDALDTDGHDRLLDAAVALIGELDVVIVAFGVLGDQKVDEAGGDGAVRQASVNYVGGVSVGLAAARRLRAQGHGVIVVLSSVAGERVRRANYLYGSSKAGLDGFAQGLGDALHGTGARVLIVRPGFVTTKMTAGRPPPPLSTTPEAVASATVAALRDGRGIVWVPGSLRFVMAVARHLPRPVFRRLRY